MHSPLNGLPSEKLILDLKLKKVVYFRPAYAVQERKNKGLSTHFKKDRIHDTKS